MLSSLEKRAVEHSLSYFIVLDQKKNVLGKEVIITRLI